MNTLCCEEIQCTWRSDGSRDHTKAKVLAGKEREAVKKDLLQLGVHPSIHVAEVFSNPGKARFDHRLGLSP